MIATEKERKKEGRKAAPVVAFVAVVVLVEQLLRRGVEKGRTKKKVLGK